MSFTSLFHVRNYVAPRLQPISIWDDFHTYDRRLFIPDIEGSVGQHLLWPYSVEKLFFQGAKNNLSRLGKFYFEGCRGSPILSDRSLCNL